MEIVFNISILDNNVNFVNLYYLWK